MKKNIFSSVFRRENLLLNAIFNFFWGIASYPRLAIEVFIRKNMGRRYFSVASAVTVAIILLWFPAGLYKGESAYRSVYGSFNNNNSFMGEYATWYIFIVLFIFFCWKRAQETFTHPNVYDYNHFSLSTGVSLPIFYNLPFSIPRHSNYQVEVFLEPGLFFIIGLILKVMDQPVGWLLIVCAICYGFSYAASYKIQNDYFQDLIDMIIMNEEIENSFINGFDSGRGVHFKDRPSSEDLRRKMASQFFPDQEAEDAEFTVV